MNFKVFSCNEWLYPDSALDGGADKAILFSARNADTCFSVLCDGELAGGEELKVDFDIPGCRAVVYQMFPAHVRRNSAADCLTTDNYEEVKHFVTRKAPFDVFDITAPTEFGLKKCRAAFYIRINVDKDAVPGQYDGSIGLAFGDESISVPLSIKIYNTVVPDLKDAKFHMVNWIYYERMQEYHDAKIGEEKYDFALAGYMENQIDLRTDYLMLPTGAPIKDESGRIVDFDLSFTEHVAQMAISKGYSRIMGGFVGTWLDWRDPDLVVEWDHETKIDSIEAFRQYKLYFDKTKEMLKRNGWEDRYMQCIADEPQFGNSQSYRTLGAICRKCMPGIHIIDAIETTDISGAVDTWVVKQAVYEQYLEDFQRLQAMGEDMWIYACGFPSGYTMNRVADLPLTVSSMILWMCYKYNCTGFLHFGYHLQTAPLYEKDICFAKGPDNCHPGGNALMVYRGDDNSVPWYGVRAHAQRMGAIDVELLNILGERDRAKADEIVASVCRSFTDYERSTEGFDRARYQLLEALG